MVLNLRTIGFQELMTFAQVIKQGGITAAANELGIAKSAVSSHITKLEERLKVKLLNRHSRRVSLTKEGESLLPKIESLIAEGSRLFEAAEQEENKPQGLVKIATTMEIAQWVLIHFLPKINQQYPDIRVVVKTAYSMEDLQDPSFDLAIRVNKINDDRLVARQIGEFHRRFYASPTLTDLSDLSQPEELRNYPSIGFSDSTTERVWKTIHHSSKEVKDIDINAVAAALNYTVIVELASAGMGICSVPSFVTQRHQKLGLLRRILPEWQSQPVPVFLAYRSGVDKIARVKAVLDLAKKELPNMLSEQFR